MPQQMGFMDQRAMMQNQFGAQATDILLGMNASVEGFNKLSQLVQFNLQSLHTFLSSVLQLMQRATVLRYELVLLFKAMALFRILYVYRLRLKRCLYTLAAKAGLIDEARANKVLLDHVWAQTKLDRDAAERVYSTLASTVYAANQANIHGAVAVPPAVLWIGTRSARSGKSILFKGLLLAGAGLLAWWLYKRFSADETKDNANAAGAATTAASQPTNDAPAAAADNKAADSPSTTTSVNANSSSLSTPPGTAGAITQQPQQLSPLHSIGSGLNPQLGVGGIGGMTLPLNNTLGLNNPGLYNNFGTAGVGMGGIGSMGVGMTMGPSMNMYGRPGLGMNTGLGPGALGSYGGMGMW